MSKVELEVVTPERIVYSEHVDMVIARAANGEIGILPGHIPFVSPIVGETVRIKNDGTVEHIKVGDGFIEVRPDKVTILAESAILSD
ncbi:MAG: ATP synthase F1 subunit epsilon [Thermoactinomyces sp.]